MSLFLPGIVPLLLFLGRSIGYSVASIRTTSYSMSLFNGAFRPGSEKVPSRISVSFTHLIPPFCYSVTGRYMGIRTIFLQILQGSQQQILYAQLWLPPAMPMLFCIAFPQNLYHLVKGCSLHPGDSPEFCA